VPGIAPEREPYAIGNDGRGSKPMAPWYMNPSLTEREVREASTTQLEKIAAGDSNPSNRRLASDELRRRRGSVEEVEPASMEVPLPFDPRREVSADAKHIASRIVTHMWTLFLLLPVCTLIFAFISGMLRYQ
jgi:hypothetical protein